jgi:hypothetical protein
VVRRLGQDAEAGSDEIVISGEPVDWQLGDQLVLTAVAAEQQQLNIYPNDNGRDPEFIGKPAGHISEECTKYNGNCMQKLRAKRTGSGVHELILVSHVSEDGHTVYLQSGLKYFHAGTTVNEGGVSMDTRDTVALLTRNVEIRGGNTALFDELRGDVTREEQMYGFTIHGEAGGTLGGSWESPSADTESETTPDTDAIFGVPQPPFKFPCGPRNYYQTRSSVDVIESGTAVFANMPVQPADGACECWPGGPAECCGCKLPPARIDIKYVTLREGGKQWSTSPNKGRDLNWIQYPTFWANSDQVGLAATYGSTLNLTGVVSGTPHTGLFCKGYKRIHLTEGVFFGNAPAFDESAKTPFASTFEKVMLVHSAKKMKNHRESRPWSSTVSCPQCPPVAPQPCNYTYLNQSDWDELMPCMTDTNEQITDCKCLVTPLKEWNGTYHPVHRRVLLTDFEPAPPEPPNILLVNNLFLPGAESTFGVFDLNKTAQKKLSTTAVYFKGQGYKDVHQSIFDNYTSIDQGCRGTCSMSNPLTFKNEGTLYATGNRVVGAYTGWTISRPCEGITWKDNVAMGNWMGAQIQGTRAPKNLAIDSIVHAEVESQEEYTWQHVTDGNISTCAGADRTKDAGRTINPAKSTWMTVDLGSSATFSRARIFQLDSYLLPREANAEGAKYTWSIYVGDNPPPTVPVRPRFVGQLIPEPDSVCKTNVVARSGWLTVVCDAPVSGRYVTVEANFPAHDRIHLCELEVMKIQACPSLPLQAYRNVIGVGATPLVPEVSNVQVVENSVGLMNHLADMPPEFWTTRAWRWANGVTDWVDSHVIGRSEKTRLMKNNCEQSWGGSAIELGGFRSGFRGINTQFHYVGIQLSSGGTRQNPSMDGPEIDGVVFSGFGLDECGRTNVAMSNEPAGWGRGSHQYALRHGGRIESDPVDSNFGFAVCAPVFVRNLVFTEVPMDYRWRFSAGKVEASRSYGDGDCTADPITGEVKSPCLALTDLKGSADYGFSECQLFDEDGSLAAGDPSCLGDVDYVAPAASRCDGSVTAVAAALAFCIGDDDGTAEPARCDPPELPACAAYCNDQCSLVECFNECIASMGQGANTETPCGEAAMTALDTRETVAQLLPWATEGECTTAGGTYVAAEADVPCELNTESPPHCLVFGGDCAFTPAISEVVGVTCELSSDATVCSDESADSCEYIPAIVEVPAVTCDLNAYGTACSDSSGASCVYEGPQGLLDAGVDPYGGITSWISSKKREWPLQFLDFCKWTLDKPDWYDTGDGANAINSCPVWLRESAEMLNLVETPAQQGVQHQLSVLQTYTDSCAASLLTGGGASDCPDGCTYSAHVPPTCAGSDDGTVDKCAAPSPCVDELCTTDEQTFRMQLSSLSTQTECEDAGGVYSEPAPCGLNYHNNGCQVIGGNCVFSKAVPELCRHDCTSVDLGDFGDSSADCPTGCVYTLSPESCLPPDTEAQSVLREVGCTTDGNAPLVGGLNCANHDFVYLNVTLKETLVSGSPLLYGPVGLSTCGSGDPIMNIIDTEYFPHNIKGGSGPNPHKVVEHGAPENIGGFWTVDGEGMDPHELSWSGCSLQGASEQEFCAVQPGLFHVANGGCVHFETTGDVTKFKRMVVQLVPWQPNLRTGRLHTPSFLSSWKIVMEIPNLNSVQVNVYKNGVYIAPVGRRMQVTSDAKTGTNYFHPMSRTLFVTVGVEKLTVAMLSVSPVDMNMDDEFEDFFGDNDLDP